MSLILEALKRSEQERRRDRVPDLRTLHQPAPMARARRQWPRWLVAGLLLININGFAFWWWQAQSTRAQSASATAQGSVPTPEHMPMANRGRLAALPDRPTSNLAVAERSGDNSILTGTPVHAVEPPLPPQTISELPVAVSESLPAMTFSFHVYSANPARRSIIINERRLRAGDEIASGVFLEEVTEEGVVLAKDRHRIYIPVLAQW